MSAATRPRISKLTCGIVLAVVIVLIVGGVWFYYGVIYQGRALSRLTGIANPVKLPDCITSSEQIISISFHKGNQGESIKDVTFVCPDGRIYSEEYNDLGVFQGSIEWTYNRNPAGQ
jgi:hypothetical protein